MGYAGGVETPALKRTDPKISIITPALSHGSMIERAVQSVAEQEYADFEHVIVDGGSTDNTLARQSHYPHLSVFSEPDRGLCDAYNKGVRLASGKVIGFLNDDDYYEAGVFRKWPRWGSRSATGFQLQRASHDQIAELPAARRSSSSQNRDRSWIPAIGGVVSIG